MKRTCYPDNFTPRNMTWYFIIENISADVPLKHPKPNFISLHELSQPPTTQQLSHQVNRVHRVLRWFKVDKANTFGSASPICEDLSLSLAQRLRKLEPLVKSRSRKASQIFEIWDSMVSQGAFCTSPADCMCSSVRICQAYPEIKPQNQPEIRETQQILAFKSSEVIFQSMLPT